MCNARPARRRCPERGIAHRYRTCRLCGQHYLARPAGLPGLSRAAAMAAGGAAWLTLLLDGEGAAHRAGTGGPPLPGRPCRISMADALGRLPAGAERRPRARRQRQRPQQPEPWPQRPPCRLPLARARAAPGPCRRPRPRRHPAPGRRSSSMPTPPDTSSIGGEITVVAQRGAGWGGLRADPGRRAPGRGGRPAGRRDRPWRWTPRPTASTPTPCACCSSRSPRRRRPTS